MDVKILILTAVFQLGVGAPVSGFPLDYQTGQNYRYAYTTDTRLNDPGLALSKKATSSQAYGPVGFRLTATLELNPVWQKGNLMLVKLVMSSPRLHSVSREVASRELQGLPRLPIYFLWDGGRVTSVFASEDDNTLAINIKKGATSLFQIQLESSQHTELDSSGECTVQYTKDDNTITKEKTECSSTDIAGQFYNINHLLGATINRTSSTTYEIVDNIIKTSHSSESFVSRVNLHQQLATDIHSTQLLEYKMASKGVVAKGESVEAVMSNIEKSTGQKYHGSTLETMFEVRQCAKKCYTFSEKVSEYKEQLNVDKMATTKAASAFLILVEACRSSPKTQLLETLSHYDNQYIIPQLLDVLTACQTTAAQEAAMEILNFSDSYYIDQPERYLLGITLSTHPSDIVLRNLLLVQEIQRTLVEGLEACDHMDKACRPMHIRALSNAGLPETIPILLKLAEEATDSAVSEAAIKAIDRMGEANIVRQEVRNVMKRIFHQERQGYDSAVRSKALALILLTNPSFVEIKRILEESADPWNTEFDSYIQARLFNAMEHNDDIRAKVYEALKNTNISNYHILAPKGKSLAFTSPMAQTDSVRADYFMYVENSKAGILKRSGMEVSVYNDKAIMPIYSFAMFAAGMEGLLGKDVEPGQEDADPTAGLALDLTGISLRPITFFTGQSGLMSAVWNAPSEPTSALQANVLLQDHSQRIHLGNGLVVEHVLQGSLSLDLSGSLSVSLWNKNAKCLIQNRSDVDFYDGIKSCLQMGSPSSQFRHTVCKHESARRFKTGITTTVQRELKINDLSYPLPKPNNEECRSLNPE